VALVNARTLSVIARKDLSALSKEKTILLAILLQLFVAMFSSFLMVGLTSLYDPSSISGYTGIEYQVGYSGEESPLKGLLESRDDIRLYPMDLSTAIAALKERQLAAVVYVPGTSPDGKGPIIITIYTVQNDIQAAIINVKLKETLLLYEDHLRDIRAGRLVVLPIELEFPDQVGAPVFYEFVYSLLIPLLLFMPAIISAALIIDLITEEYEHHTLETLLSAPVSMGTIIWGKILACFILVPLQAGAWIVLLTLNRIPISSVPLVMIHVLLVSLFLIVLGAVIALYYRERTGAQVIFSLAVVVLMLVVLATPGNPFNQVTALSTGGPGNGSMIVLALVAAGIVMLALLIQRFVKATVI
jgi:hypothetical protein